MHTVEFQALDTQIRISAPSNGLGAMRLLEAAVAALAEYDRALGRPAQAGDLYELHRQRPAAVRVTPVLFRAVRAAVDAKAVTEGLYDALVPTVAPAGVVRTLDPVGAGRLVRPPAMAAPARSIALDDARMTAALPAGWRLDIAVLGRALAVDSAAGQLSDLRGFMIEAGGDLRLSDAGSSAAPWRIAVGEPGNADRALTYLSVREGAIATRASGAVTDHRTGRPAQSDVLAATVVAGTMVGAHIFAQATVIGGAAAALELLERRCMAGLLVLTSGDVRLTSRMRAYLAR